MRGGPGSGSALNESNTEKLMLDSVNLYLEIPLHVQIRSNNDSSEGSDPDHCSFRDLGHSVGHSFGPRSFPLEPLSSGHGLPAFAFGKLSAQL